MPKILTRIGRRKRSTHTTSSPETTVSEPSGWLSSGSETITSVSQPQPGPSLVAQHIHPDLNALAEGFTPREESAEHGLSPPGRRSMLGEALVLRTDLAGEDSPQRERRHARWATFGRENRKTSGGAAPAGEIEWPATSRSPSRVERARSRKRQPPSAFVPYSVPASRTGSRAPSTLSRRSSLSVISANPNASAVDIPETPSSAYATPLSRTNTAPSASGSRSSRSSRSSARPATHPMPAIMLSQASASVLDSPGTFGLPTPVHAREGSYNFGAPLAAPVFSVSRSSSAQTPNTPVSRTSSSESRSPVERAGTFPRRKAVGSAVGFGQQSTSSLRGGSGDIAGPFPLEIEDSDTRDLCVPDWQVAAGGASLSHLFPPSPHLSELSASPTVVHNLSPGDGTHALSTTSPANELPLQEPAYLAEMSTSTPGAGSSRSHRTSRTQSASHLQAIFKPPTPTVTSFGSAVQNALREPGRSDSVRVTSSSPPRPSALRSTSEPETPQNGKGKRKADEIERTPPDDRQEKEKEKQRTTFAPDPRGHRVSNTDSSQAPSSSTRKRPRTAAPPPPRPTSPLQGKPSRDTFSSRTGAPPPLRPPSRAHTHASTRSAVPPSPTEDREDARSHVSIPLSALMTPHAPSIGRSVSMSTRGGAYHMRDPRRPRVRPTPWALRGGGGEEAPSAAQAWMFYAGFVLFVLWWLASVWRIPETRSVGGGDSEKAVVVDDPQIEHDARSWRTRCRIMAVVSLFTYVPFIVCIAIFAPRS